jgi:hypothetical protein
MEFVHPRICVFMPVFNHEAFLSLAVHSVWEQTLVKDIEIRVHDDCSTDGSWSLLKELAAASPVPMHLTRAPRNRYSRDGFTFWFETFAQTGSEFVAFLEGDDWWTDPRKLERQVALLDAHPEAALCHHKFISCDADGKVLRSLDWPPPQYRDVLLPGELLAQTNFIGTLTVLARRYMIPDLPAGFGHLPLADYPLWALMTAGRKIAYVDSEMAAYRHHAEGLFTSGSREERADVMLAGRMFIVSHLTGDARIPWLDAIARDLRLPAEQERIRLADRVEVLGHQVHSMNDSLVDLGHRLDHSQREVLMLQRSRDDLERELMEALNRPGVLEDQIARMQSSWSWKLTRPLRSFRRLVK